MKQEDNRFKRHDHVRVIGLDIPTFKVIRERDDGIVELSPKDGGMFYVAHKTNLEKLN